MPVSVAASKQHQNPVDLPLFDKLYSVRRVELPGSSRGQTLRQRVVGQQTALPAFVECLRPGMERRHAVGVRKVEQNSVVVHRDLGAGVFHQSGDTGHSPVACFARLGTEPYLSIRPAWRRTRRDGRCIGRGSEDRIAGIGQNHRIGEAQGAGPSGRRRFDPHDVAEPNRVVAPSGLFQVEDVSEFEGPVDDVSVAVLDVDEEVGVGVNPVDSGYRAFQRDPLRIVVGGRVRMMRDPGRRYDSQCQSGDHGHPKRGVFHLVR